MVRLCVFYIVSTRSLGAEQKSNYPYCVVMVISIIWKISTFYINDESYAQSTSRRLVKYRRKSKMDVGIFRAIANAIDKIKPDVIHAWLPPAITIPALVVGWWKNVPVVVSYRNAKRTRLRMDLLEYIFTVMFASGIASNTSVELCSLPYRWLYRWKNSILIRNGVSIPINHVLLDDRKIFEIWKALNIVCRKINQAEKLEMFVGCFGNLLEMKFLGHYWFVGKARMKSRFKSMW